MGDNPCMDMFGSNATPMGGSIGRADAMIGATEAQKAEGVLHLHFFIYLQMAHQHLNLSEIADLLRQKLLSLQELKAYHDHARCASYPDLPKFEIAKVDIEKAWPVYAADSRLSRAPLYVWSAVKRAGDGARQTLPRSADTASLQAWHDEGKRKPLSSCQPKNKPKECEACFPSGE